MTIIMEIVDPDCWRVYTYCPLILGVSSVIVSCHMLECQSEEHCASFELYTRINFLVQ